MSVMVMLGLRFSVCCSGANDAAAFARGDCARDVEAVERPLRSSSESLMLPSDSESDSPASRYARVERWLACALLPALRESADAVDGERLGRRGVPGASVDA